jgi:hypothetical protein
VPIVFLPSQPRRPFVELRVGQSVGYFLLDTGAGGHVMSDWFFRAAYPGRPLRGAPATAVDFAGVPIPTTLVSGLDVQWADGLAGALTFSVGPFSRPADSDGMAGIISPQSLLASWGAVELDFPGRTLRAWREPGGEGLEYALEARTLRACPAGTQAQASVYAWAVGVEGEALWAMMDSGSPVTALARDGPLGQRLWPLARPIEAGRGLSNAPLESRAIPVRVDFGGLPWRAEVALLKLPLASCGTRALLGMNLLERCAVTLARDRGWVRCLP